MKVSDNVNVKFEKKETKKKKTPGKVSIFTAFYKRAAILMIN